MKLFHQRSQILFNLLKADLDLAKIGVWLCNSLLDLRLVLRSNSIKVDLPFNFSVVMDLKVITKSLLEHFISVNKPALGSELLSRFLGTLSLVINHISDILLAVFSGWILIYVKFNFFGTG